MYLSAMVWTGIIWVGDCRCENGLFENQQAANVVFDQMVASSIYKQAGRKTTLFGKFVIFMPEPQTSLVTSGRTCDAEPLPA